MSGPPPPMPPMPPSFTHRVERSPLLDRLSAFLPQLKAANEQLEQDIKENGAEKYSFEDTTGCENPIRLQLSIGVLEQQKIEAESAEDAEKAAMNPHNLAILPSELDEQKKLNGKEQDIVLPWDFITTKNTNIDDDESTHQALVTMVEEEFDEDDEENEEGDDTTDPNANKTNKKTLKKLRKSNTTNSTMTDVTSMQDDDTQLPLLGSITQPNEDMMLEKDSMRLGSHLFTDEDPVMTAAEAVAVLRGLGYEAVSDISLATPYHTVDEMDTNMGDGDDDNDVVESDVGKKKMMVEEVADQ